VKQFQPDDSQLDLSGITQAPPLQIGFGSEMAKETIGFKPTNVDLTGQFALVTGASRGIGRAIALQLSRCGATVGCVSTNKEKLEAGTVAEIRAAGGTAEAFAGDLSNVEEVNRIVGEVEAAFGKIHILVNNAGITRDDIAFAMEDAKWHDVIQTNLNGVFYCCRAVSRVMMRQRYGRIVNIASVSGIIGNFGQANYSAAKAGVIALTRVLAKELSGRNITANAVAPGFIETDMTAALKPEIKEKAMAIIPLKRFGKPEEIADAVSWVASPGASYLTGQVIAVDGGMSY
jgi:3-oxoacyl-[acyl-carrier protein] reductase